MKWREWKYVIAILMLVAFATFRYARLKDRNRMTIVNTGGRNAREKTPDEIRLSPIIYIDLS